MFSKIYINKHTVKQTKKKTLKFQCPVLKEVIVVRWYVDTAVQYTGVQGELRFRGKDRFIFFSQLLQLTDY